MSVLIPTRNRRNVVVVALRSALAQRDVAVEVVVTDDGSTDGTSDGTSEALAALNDERLTIIRHGRSEGVAAARNSALAVARGRYIAFLDDDDVWSPHKLRSQLDAITLAPGARWSCVGAVWLDDGQVGRPERPPEQADQSDALLQRNTMPGGASGVLAERKLVTEVGGFDVSFSTMADWDLWVRLALRSPVAAVDRPLVGYAIHAASMSHDVARLLDEYAHFADKYAAERQRRGVDMDRTELLWYCGAWSLRKGDRWGAAKAHARLALSLADRPGRAAAAALVGLVWPGVQRRRDLAGARRLTSDWCAEVQEWVPEALRPGAPTERP